MMGILNELSPKERKILEMRHGLTDDGICYTLEEVGREFGVTRERIRQIEAKALERFVSTNARSSYEATSRCHPDNDGRALGAQNFYCERSGPSERIGHFAKSSAL